MVALVILHSGLIIRLKQRAHFYLQSVEQGREWVPVTLPWIKCPPGFVNPHMAFPCTHTCCSICVWLFAQQRRFIFFLSAEMGVKWKAKLLLPDCLSGSKDDWFSQADVGVEEKMTIPESKVALTSIPTLQPSTDAITKEGWDQDAIAVLSSGWFPDWLRTSTYDTRSTTELQLLWRT